MFCGFFKINSFTKGIYRSTLADTLISTKLKKKYYIFSLFSENVV